MDFGYEDNLIQKVPLSLARQTKGIVSLIAPQSFVFTSLHGNR